MYEACTEQLERKQMMDQAITVALGALRVKKYPFSSQKLSLFFQSG